jgi:hypothetical protein
MTRFQRRLAAAALIVLVLVLIVFVGLHFAVRQLQAQVENALGPRASIGAIQASWGSVEVLDLRIQGAPGWPAEDELRASRVRITPDLRSLLGGPWRIASVQVEGGYVSMLRSKDGKLRVLPALLDKAASAQPATAASATEPGAVLQLVIGQVKLVAASLDFYDASVRQPAVHLRIDQLDSEVGPLALPDLNQTLQLKLAGVFKGSQRDGHINLQGEVNLASRDAQIHANFAGVDLVTLQPYLLKIADTGIRHGSLDLDLNATVQHNHLKAPGKLALTQLELSSDSALATFAGLPRKAVLAAMTERGRLEVKFTLEGRLDDPAFSLNENLATKIASGLADSLGVSLSSVVKGLGGVVKGLFGR